MPHCGHMPRYRRHFVPGHAVFLTIVSDARRPWRATPGARETVLGALRSARALHPFIHHGHVVLDDHLHLLLTPRPGMAVPNLVGSFKRAAMAALPKGITQAGERLWQRRYYDHVIRDDADFVRHLDYIHFNPVKHGAAARPCDWIWSSFHAWHARGVYPDDWGCGEPPPGCGVRGASGA